MFGQAYKKEYLTNIKIAAPVVIGQVGHMTAQIADSMMVGHLGADVLAASAFAGMLFLIILLTLIGLATGITTLIGNANGEGDRQKAFEILGNSFWATLIFSIFSVGILLLAQPVLYHLGQEKDVVDIALPYYRILCWSAIPLIIFLSLKHFTEGLEWTMPAMAVSIVANVLNIALNYILIFGKLGYESYGIEGAGYATLISRVLMALVMILLLYSHPRLSFYKTALVKFKWSLERLLALFRIGFPIGLQYLLEGGAFIAATLFIGFLGAEHLAGHQIALNISSFTFMFATGLSATATIRVSNLVGAGHFERLKTVSISLFVMIVVAELLFAYLMIATRELLPGLYVDEPDVILIAGKLLIVAAFFQVSDGIQVVAMGALRGISDVNVPTSIALMAYWIIGIPVGLALMEFTPLKSIGIWYGLLIGLSIAAVLLTIRFAQLLKRQTGKPKPYN